MAKRRIDNYANGQSLIDRVVTVAHLIDAAAELMDSFFTEVCETEVKPDEFNMEVVLTILDNFSEITSSVGIINSNMFEIESSCLRKIREEVNKNGA